MKVFRAIRKKQLLSGKTKNHIVYALGEILLIVIGILIAWKINDLNEIRKNKIVQEKIYQSLYEELHTNLEVLDSSLLQYNNSSASLQKTLNFVGLDSLSKADKDVIILVNFKSANLRNEALSSVNFTDKFQFLENDTLAELIAEYPSELKSFQEQELKIKNIVNNRLKPVLEEHLSLIDILPEVNNNYNQIRTYGQKSNYSALLNCKEYQNSIIDQLLQTKIQLNITMNLRKKTQILSIKLKQELED
ncbi:hypothetical protein [Formosa algae]|uniref:Uncharacterized protein n=1 Tax=Formosa algae TaxID=225843 RepID=A0A9X0YMA2_9FLAO|nr:hypothetical protein [Formosa algae]MBP1841620.1 hypothetical protein [Formosa algae]MDQ0336987.1 hypothetical protein [Formosa algae]OEI80243.1 hypothetical protein AST99_10690 [Formosa algae]PNW26535.1 hypothetical protein BKP44_16505 [Formosa algae]